MHPEYSSLRGLGQTERHVLNELSRIGRPVIAAEDLEHILGFNRKASNLVLSRLCKKGWLQRLRSGIYRIIPFGSESADPLPDDGWAIATALFSPCYISGWSAAEHWELTEQIFNTTVVFTSLKQRKSEQIVSGLKYRTKHVPIDSIFGVKKIWSSNVPVQIADIHRTIIDVLDDPEIGGGGRHTVDIVREYFLQKDANPDKLFEYAARLGHGSVFKRLGVIGEAFASFSEDMLKNLHNNIKTGIIKFDPHGPDTGPIISKWGVRVNIPLEDLK